MVHLMMRLISTIMEIFAFHSLAAFIFYIKNITCFINFLRPFDSSWIYENVLYNFHQYAIMNMSYMPYTGIVICFSVWNICYYYSYITFAYGTSNEKNKTRKVKNYVILAAILKFEILSIYFWIQ